MTRFKEWLNDTGYDIGVGLLAIAILALFSPWIPFVIVFALFGVLIYMVVRVLWETGKFFFSKKRG